MTDRDNREAIALDKRNKAVLLAGVDSSGHVRVANIEEVRFQGPGGGYDGLVLATHEQVQQLMRSGFTTLAGGRASADGTVPSADQAADGTAQRILVDEMGRIWVVPVASPPVVEVLATALAPSVFATAYTGLATTSAISVAGAKRVLVDVAYTPAATGDGLWIYPQLSILTPAAYRYVQQVNAGGRPMSGPTTPPTVQRPVKGNSMYAPFESVTTTGAAAASQLFELDANDWRGALSLRFALRSTAVAGPGVVTLTIAVQYG